MHASSGAEARLRASSSEFAAHARRPRARAHAPGGGRAGSRRGIRTRRRMQAGMDTCGLAHASEAAPGRQERRPAPRWEPAAPLGTCRRLPLRIPIPSIGNPQFWAGVHKPDCEMMITQSANCSFFCARQCPPAAALMKEEKAQRCHSACVMRSWLCFAAWCRDVC